MTAWTTACGGDRAGSATAHAAPSSATDREPDALVLRVPRRGGVAHVVALPAVDSVVWTSGRKVL